MHDRLTYSVGEAAGLLGISRTKAYESIRAGKLRAERLGRRLVVPAHALDGVLGLGEQAHARAGVLNQVEVAGRLTRRPEQRQTRTGNQMATFRLAVGGRNGERGLFIDVVAFGEPAGAATALTKGQHVFIAGRLDQREWRTEHGARRTVHQIVARRIEVLEPPPRDPTASSEPKR